MKQSKRFENKTALAIRSEMTPATAKARPAITPQAAIRPVESIRLREYADRNMTSIEMVTMFLQDVSAATRADISGATGLAWATVHNALMELEGQRHLRRQPNTEPEEYSWKP